MASSDKISSSPRAGETGRPEETGAEAPRTYRMEEIVRRTGVTPRAIRYYEEMGLLSPSGRTAGGFRLFTDAEVTQLLKIKELQTLLGFSLAEIKETLHADAARAEIRHAYHQTTDPSTRLGLVEQAVGLAQSQVRVINERMARLAKLHEELDQSLGRLRAHREQLLREIAERQSSGEKSSSDQARDEQ